MYSVATYRTSLDNNAEDLSSQNFFTQNREEDLFRWRHAIQRGEKHLYCGFCGQPLKISGGGDTKQRLHFRHKFKHAAEGCVYQDEENLTKREIELRKYANEEESDLHRHLKFYIAGILKDYGAETRIEQYIQDENRCRNYRRPDIHAIFSDKDVAVEIQRTSTFPSIILGREDFYSARKMFLIWVLVEFRPDLFYQKDIFYSSKNNAFVFDEEARKRTEDEHKLYLKCYYKSYYCNYQGEIVEHTTFQHKLITFDDLIFDEKDYSVYYFDVQKNKQQCEIEQKVIKERIQKEQEQRRKEQEAIRIQKEKEERERARLWHIEQEKLREQEEQRKREEEDLRRKEEAERKERERLYNVKRRIQNKIEDYIYRESISLEDLWQYYQQLKNEEKGFADEELHSIIHKSVYHHYVYYENKYIYDKHITDLYCFLWKNNYSFDKKQFEDIPLAYFKRPYYELNINLYEYITLNLYINHNYHLPDKERYLSKITKRFTDIIEESKSRDKYCDYAASFKEIEMIILCYERLNDSPFAHSKDTYKLVYNKRDIIRHLFSIYLGELVGKDFDEKRYYRPFFNELASPYYHLYKRMMECRRLIFQNHGLVPNMYITLTEIERNIRNAGITPNYDLDALMPIIFPDIQWALQQTLF